MHIIYTQINYIFILKCLELSYGDNSVLGDIIKNCNFYDFN